VTASRAHRLSHHAYFPAHVFHRNAASALIAGPSRPLDPPAIRLCWANW